MLPPLLFPKPQQQFQQRRFAAAAFADDADNFPLLRAHAHVLQHGRIAVGKGKIGNVEPFKPDVLPVRDLGDGGLFGQQIEHSVAARKGLREIAGKCGDREDGPET